MNETEVQKKFLGALAKSSSEFRMLARNLHRDPRFTRVGRSMDIVETRDGVAFEEYLEVELGDGTVLCYWFEILMKDIGYEIEASILRNKYSEQETLMSLPTPDVVTYANFEDTVERVTNSLVTADITQWVH